MQSILIVSFHLPYPLDSGGNQAQFHMIEGIRNCYNIHFLVEIRSFQEIALKELKQKWPNVTFHEFRQFEYEASAREPFKIGLLRKLHKSISRKIKRWERSEESDFTRKNSMLYESLFQPMNSDYLKFFTKTITETKYDLIQVEFFETLSLGHLIPKEQKSVFVIHEPRWIRNEREMKLFKETTFLDTYTMNVAKSYEIGCLNNFRYLITLSDIDKVKVKLETINSKIYCSPASISLPTSPTNDKNNIDSLIFVGGGGHYPNKDGLIWFCEEVAPLIKSRFKLKVTGTWDSESRTHIKSLLPSTVFIGFVTDLANELKTSISIVPIRIGGGIRMKIIEAAQSFSPFITTTCGVEGLNFIHETECLIADSPIFFAQHVDKLLNNKNLQLELATNAHHKILKLCSSETQISKRLEIYNEILNH